MSLPNPTGRITPLWIVAAFVTLTEAVLGYALTRVEGGVQVALTVFVIGFALIVASAFFAILWNRPYVFYSPSEYQTIDPKQFVEALRPAVPPRVAEQLSLAASVRSDPSDTYAQFKLIDSMLDESHRQHVILMREFNCELPYRDFFTGGHDYLIEYKSGFTQGGFRGSEFVKKLEGTGFISMVVNDGPKILLTDSGQKFADWLVENGKRAQYMQTPFGTWGKPQEDGLVARRKREKDQSVKAQAATDVPFTQPTNTTP